MRTPSKGLTVAGIVVMGLSVLIGIIAIVLAWRVFDDALINPTTYDAPGQHAIAFNAGTYTVFELVPGPEADPEEVTTMSPGDFEVSEAEEIFNVTPDHTEIGGDHYYAVAGIEFDAGGTFDVTIARDADNDATEVVFLPDGETLSAQLVGPIAIVFTTVTGFFIGLALLVYGRLRRRPTPSPIP